MTQQPKIPALRDPNQVMTLRQMGAMFPTRLSFLRSLTRRLAHWSSPFEVTRWDMDADGYGTAVLSVGLGGRIYSLVALSSALDDADRSDRVIATAWDAAFVLFDGVPDQANIDRIAANAPLQEAGRMGPKDLVLSRANKSVRLWANVVQALKAGRQPSRLDLGDCGYLMRTTAVYGNGKFGLADRHTYAARPELAGPFAAEMLAVWLIREFSHHLVEHVGGAPLDLDIRRGLGIGNATGLGMAPFLVSHPLLLDAWMQVRETAFARVLALPAVPMRTAEKLVSLAARGRDYLASWQVDDPGAQSDIDALRADWQRLTGQLTASDLAEPGALRALLDQAQTPACQEFMVSWMIEPFGDLVDGLTDCLATPFEPTLDPAMSCATLRGILDKNCDWATGIDASDPASSEAFWYISEEKLEPRLGHRATDHGAERQTPLDIALRIHALAQDLKAAQGPVCAFLADHPQHRFAVRRVQAMPYHPYCEVRDNLTAHDVAPIHLLRAKLAMFGAGRFDPKSTLWTRVTLAQGAPLAEDLRASADPDDWWMA